jgi:hypothetical protein
MARPALHIEVSAKDRKILQELVSGGVHRVRVVLRLWRFAVGVRRERPARLAG